MSLILREGPAAEPLSLADAKAWLRLDHDDDDSLVGALVTAARLQAEAMTGRVFVTQKWRLVLDFWPARGTIAVPLVPLVSVEAARVFQADKVLIELDPDGVKLDAASRPPRLYVANRPVPRREAGIEFDLVAGYGGGPDVPEVFRQAIRLLIAHWYENRTLLPIAGDPLPYAVAALLAPQRALRL